MRARQPHHDDSRGGAANERFGLPGTPIFLQSLFQSGRADSTAAITELMREPHENRGLRLGLPGGNPSARFDRRRHQVTSGPMAAARPALVASVISHGYAEVGQTGKTPALMSLR